ncbi:hypothetical protein ACLMAJ_35510 [Nocardia sp. KC 131]|uniref:hypothetical protein n=1 Tax=Nocardia arseniciresistens TaxID=3392119 RepID=UPI00398F65E0
MTGVAHKIASSRRTFIAGAISAGLAATLAADLPAAAAGPTSDPVKLVSALRRRADLSSGQFFDY